MVSRRGIYTGLAILFMFLNFFLTFVFLEFIRQPGRSIYYLASDLADWDALEFLANLANRINNLQSDAGLILNGATYLQMFNIATVVLAIVLTVLAVRSKPKEKAIKT